MKFKYTILISLLVVNSILSAPKSESKPTTKEATTSSSNSSISDIFKRSGYVTTLATLREIEGVLVKIDVMNKEILQKRKQKDAEIQQLSAELSRKVKEGETSLKQLRDDIETEFTNEVEDLKRRIARNEGNISELEAALKAESTILSNAKKLNSWTLGYAQTVVNWASSAETVRREDLSKQVKKLQGEIETWKKTIASNKEKMAKIFATNEFKKKQENILQELNDTKTELQQIASQVEGLEKEIIASYSNPAEELIKTLKKLINKAGCSTIKTIADAKPATIKACKERYLARIKRSYPKVAACQRLTIDSSVEDIKKCK